jgi:ectoine hydroxylase-related dioxygenase (phytanoyl-CoA dioxygenase family)
MTSGGKRFTLARRYPLASEQCEAYRRDGHILLRGVATQKEVGQYGPLITGIVDDVVRRRDRQKRLDDYSAMFTQVTNIWRMSEEAKPFVLAERFGRIAAELMGVKGVRLYHDQALIKEPGGRATPWHQDHFYWPLATEDTITMWLALVDIPPEMGSMSFATGSHRNAAIPQIPISDRSQEFFERLIHEGRTPTPHYALNAGDATFHSGDILHCAHGNSGSRRREVLTVIYYADGTRIMEPDHEHRRVDLEVFHPGCKPGDLAASELNPIIFEG